MERREFLNNIGAGAAFALTTTCLGGCGNNDSELVLPELDGEIIIDLSDPANSNLQSDGGYIIKDRIVIARTIDGNYVAATQLCSHEDRYDVIYEKGRNEWFCTAHDARFALDGEGLNNTGKNGLTVYETTLTGSELKVFSS